MYGGHLHIIVAKFSHAKMSGKRSTDSEWVLWVLCWWIGFSSCNMPILSIDYTVKLLLLLCLLPCRYMSRHRPALLLI